MDLGLRERVVLVTGGSSGIGLATLEMLLREDALVATCARDGRRLRKAVEHLDPARVLARVCDVTDAAACTDLVEAAVERFGRLDALVNNAGQGRSGRLNHLTESDWRSELDGKVFGIVNPSRAAVEHLTRSDAPRIVNISAVSAREPDPSMLAISAARAAGSNLSRGLAAELASRKILVNTVTVGVIATGRTQERHRSEAAELDYSVWAEQEAVRRGVPLARISRQLV